jgi:hypothetical protein
MLSKNNASDCKKKMKITSVPSLTRKITRFLSIDSVESEEQSFDTSVDVDDIEFDFLDIGEIIEFDVHDQCHHSLELNLDDHEDKDQNDANEKDRYFWDTQHQGLQVLYFFNHISSCFFKLIYLFFI